MPGDLHPSWSPDGKQLVFERIGAGLYLTRSDRPAAPRFVAVGAEPAWSPAGPLAFLRPLPLPQPITVTCGSFQDDIFVRSALTSPSELKLTSTPETSEHALAWARDGSRIAFASNAGIAVVNKDGGERRQLTQLTPSAIGQTILQIDTAPSWSPDGRRLVFARAYGAFVFDLVVMNDEGGAQAPLTRTPKIDETEPDWSPDGRRIAFTATRTDSSGRPAVMVMNLDGKGRHRLGWGSEPTWSPDGRRIAYVATSRNGSSRVFVMHADGSGKKQLTNSTFSSLSAARAR